MKRTNWTLALAIVALAMLPMRGMAASCDVFGDVNGNGVATVPDVQCAIITALWILVDDGSPHPGCAAGGAVLSADLDCDLAVTVSDAQLSIIAVLGSALSPAIDADGSGCPDACEAGPVPCTQCDDGNPCTDDFCAAAACIFEPIDGGGCDDADACTTGDVCSGGECVGAPVVCEQDADCQFERICDPTSGCRFDSDGLYCDDPDSACQGPFCYLPGVCGDAWCDQGESAATCPSDCLANCDGVESLCAKPLADVTWVGTHSSTWVHPSPHILEGGRQLSTIMQQFSHGVRYFDVPVAHCANGSGICVAGPMGPTELNLMNVAVPLRFQQLAGTAGGLAPGSIHKPNKVIVLRTSGVPADEVAAALAPGGIKMLESTAKWGAGTIHVSYQNLLNRDSGFLIAHDSADVAYFARADLPATPLANPEACFDSAGNLPPADSLYVISHYRSFNGLGSKTHAECMNAPSVMAEVWQDCVDATGRAPNAVVVDFVDERVLAFADAARNGSDLLSFPPASCILTPSLSCPGGGPACPSGDCPGDSYCAECASELDCQMGEYCDPITAQCLPVEPVTEPCGADSWCEGGHCSNAFCAMCSAPFLPCPADQVCAANGICVFTSDPGEPCETDANCTAGTCLDFVEVGKICVLCQDDEECGASTYCEPVQGCVPKHNPGEDCQGGLQCVSGACYQGQCGSCGPDAACGYGSWCATDSECDLQVPVGAPCSSDSECRDGTLCRQGTCKECSTHPDCADGMFCKAEKCVKKGIAGHHCSNGNECQSGRCLLGSCDVDCYANADCPAGYGCEPYLPQSASNSFDVDDTDNCDPGVQGGSCITDIQIGANICFTISCQTNYQIDGKCGRFCGKDAHCAPFDAFCDNGECRQKFSNSYPCSRDADCLGGFCVNGVCSSCASDADCHPAMHCVHSLLVNDCIDDGFPGDHCYEAPPLGQAKNVDCYEGYCSLSGTCSECLSDSHCGASRYCTEFRACEDQKDLGALCGSHNQCLSGHCDAQCVQCLSHGDCGPTEWCSKPALAVNTCEPKLGLGSDCVDDGQCLSDVCGEGQCATACSSHAECGATEFCEPLGQFCKDKFGDGTFGCTGPAQCESGTCTLGLCVDPCSSDAGCESSQYCDLGLGTCVDDKANGVLCFADSECVSGHCDVECVVCTQDSHCASGQFCKLVALGQNECTGDEPLGSACTIDQECLSGKCGDGQCVIPCAQQSECPVDSWCAPIAAFCVPKVDNGAICLENFECQSGICDGVCSECKLNSDCDPGQFCNDLLIGINTCEPLKALGEACDNGTTCASGHCDLVCVECLANDHCGANQYCHIVVFEQNFCKDLVPINEPCNFNFECETTLCSQVFGTCGCTTHAQCEADQWCDAIDIACKPKRPIGGVCSDPAVCQSGVCDVVCVQCLNDSHCGPDEWCHAKPGPDDSCDPKVDYGEECTVNNQCLTGLCADGECTVACDDDLGCLDTQFCEPVAKYCRDKFPLGEFGCLEDNQCISGHCTNVSLTCVGCESDLDCSAFEYCNGALNCEVRKPIGVGCGDDGECISGQCDVVCVECKTAAACPSGEYCKVVVGVLNTCEPQVGLGGACSTDPQCTTQNCWFGTCECLADADCTASQYCRFNAFTGYTCEGKLGTGGTCSKDSACVSGKCGEGKCAIPCTADSGCGATQFCEPVGKFCKDKFPLGPAVGCTGDNQCLSGACIELTLTCVGCVESSHCSASQYCENTICKEKVAQGANCSAGQQCLSGKCGEGKCATACSADSGCPSGQFCEPAGKFCKAKFPNGVGVGCTADNQCTSGHCLEIALSCVQCETNSHCSASQYCSVNSCLTKKSNGSSCGFDDECTSNKCGEGVCNQACAADSNCPSGNFCEPLGKFCKAKFPNGVGVGCTSDNQCTSGHCLEIALSCVECETNANCGASGYCSGNACLAKKSDGSTCAFDDQCTSNKCGDGVCVTACTSDAGCSSNQFCEPTAKFCKAKFGNGVAIGCTADGQCQSGHCLELFLSCVQCESSSHCSSSQVCSANTCVAKKSNGASCSFGDECLSNKCGEGKCATACSSDAGCSSSQFCEPAGLFCKAKFPNGVGVGCTANNQCQSGQCFVLALTCF